MCENSMVVGATEEYEKQNGEYLDEEVRTRNFERFKFVKVILAGGQASGKNGKYFFGDILATMPQRFADEFQWAEDSTILRIWLDGSIPEWETELTKQAFILADTAIGEALD
jgi:hypothetical protein